MTKRDLQYYKDLNYKIVLNFDSNDGCWYARMPELGSILADGVTREEALANILKAKNEVLEEDFKRGLPISEPREDVDYSGRFLLRIPKTLHKNLAEEAEREGTSINRLAIQIISEELVRRIAKTSIADWVRETAGTALAQTHASTSSGTALIAKRQTTGLLPIDTLGRAIIYVTTFPKRVEAMENYYPGSKSATTRTARLIVGTSELESDISEYARTIFAGKINDRTEEESA